MKRKVQLLAWHGWGFDRSCWEPWRRLLPQTVSTHCYDRGYWGNPQNIALDQSLSHHVLLTHSFGLHLCPAKQLAAANLVVIFGGFREFHPVAAQFKRRSRLVLNNMIQSLQESPESVLEKFLVNTFKPEDPPDIKLDGFDGEKLLHDLHTLNQSSLDIEPLMQAKKVCILHGSADSIVPKNKGRELYNLLHTRASYFEMKGAGHAMPFTHTEQCWGFIKPLLDEIIHMSK